MHAAPHLINRKCSPLVVVGTTCSSRALRKCYVTGRPSPRIVRDAKDKNLRQALCPRPERRGLPTRRRAPRPLTSPRMARGTKQNNCVGALAPNGEGRPRSIRAPASFSLAPLARGIKKSDGVA